VRPRNCAWTRNFRKASDVLFRCLQVRRRTNARAVPRVNEVRGTKTRPLACYHFAASV
jgi:hypothetical protein